MQPITLCVFYFLCTIYLDPKNVLSVWIICCLCGALSEHGLHYNFIERKIMYVTEQFVQGGRDKLLDCVIMTNHTGLLGGKWKHFISLYLSVSLLSFCNFLL